MPAYSIKKIWLYTISFSACCELLHAQRNDYPIQPVDFTQVHINDKFWTPKIAVNAGITIPYVLDKCKETGRINNFLEAAGVVKSDKLTEFPFDDTDLYKVIEGASYSLQEKPDAKLEQYIDTLITYIGAAQEPDGYLYTFRTVKAAKPHPWIGATRWEKEEELSHELYNAGHLYEAAVAHYKATGKKSLLNIAIKNADLLVKDFGWGKVEAYPGHQIVELGLAKLYRVTGNKAYLDLAKFFLDVRGPKGDSYNQAKLKVTDQHEAEGHAVRAAYMYTGMADVAALTGDKKYLTAIDSIWNNVADKKLYITGGIGSTGGGEAFGKDYQLPNMSAYAETCAAIANVYWNSRMFLLHGDSRYIDVLERTLYNGLLSGVSLSGNRFFYPNPLASMGQHQRSAWFSCACCISNMTRFLPSVPGYVYAHNSNDLYVNLFMSNNSSIKLTSGIVNISQITDYPWQGSIALQIDPAHISEFSLKIRVPGWAVQKPAAGDLYTDMKQTKTPVTLLLNGKPVVYKMDHGYAVIKRTWKKGDKVMMELPMDVEKVVANKNVVDDLGRFALQRGPVLYCLEGPDNKDSLVQSIMVPQDAVVKASYNDKMLNGITMLFMKGISTKRQLNTEALIKTEQQVVAIPYYSWANRGPGEMVVWIPYEESAVKPRPAPTIASTSKVSSSLKNSRSYIALNDQIDPVNSADQSNTYLHWWPKNNTREWVQYDFDTEHTISQSQVYWYDDGPFGGCRIPVSWKISYKKGEEWIPVVATTPYENVKDQFNKVKFEPVTTTAVRLEVQLPEKNSTGIHEWIVK